MAPVSASTPPPTWGLVVVLSDHEQLLEGRFPSVESALEEAKIFARQAAFALRSKEDDTEIKVSRPAVHTNQINIGSGQTGKVYMTVRPVLVDMYIKARK